MKPGAVVHLNIAEMVVAREPAVVSTVLGSCISVCLYSPSTGVGGMIHFALPQADAHGQVDGEDDRLKYGNTAVPALVDAVCRCAKSNPPSLVAKIVGGAACLGENGSAAGIGKQNEAVALSVLKEYGIPVIGCDTGGEQGRKVFFFTNSGRLRVSVLGQGSRPERGQAGKHLSAVSGTADRKKRVLIVDDSKTIQQILKKILSEEPKLEVVGVAPNPIVATKMAKDLRPDVITLDIHMPEMDGVTFLERFLPGHPIPVVMITSVSQEESDHVLRALELGAVDYIQKPSMQELKESGQWIREKVLTAASIKVRRIGNRAIRPVRQLGSSKCDFSTIVAIGSSTGGTEALKEVLASLPEKIPPILIVQHIPPVFSTAFARRLNELCPFEVKEAVDGDKLAPGRVLIAPGGLQMCMEKFQGGFRVKVTDAPPVNRHKPSVDYLFDSIAKIAGPRTIGVILTGMGNDGAKGLLNLKRAGARTVGQSEETCVVYGMPKAAFELGATEEMQPLERIAEVILKWSSQRKTA